MQKDVEILRPSSLLTQISSTCWSEDIEYQTVQFPADEEKKELYQMTSRAVGRVALSALGGPDPNVAQIHDSAEATVYEWVDRFDK